MLGYFVEATAKAAEPLLQRRSTHLHPPPDAGQPGALHHRRAGRAGRRDRPGRASARWPSSSRLSRPGAPPCSRPPPIQAAAEAARRGSTSPPALAEWADERRYVRPRIDDGSTAFEAEGARHPVVEEALRRAGDAFTPTTAASAPATAGPAGLRHRPEHGRQVDLPAPERAAGRAGPGRLLRAGQAAAARRRRPPVQPRRRRRRPGARPLDLHGRDGRDRRHPDPGHAAQPGDPGRDRPRHGHLRRPGHRLGLRRGTCTRSTAAGRCSPPTTTSWPRWRPRLAHVCQPHAQGQGVERRPGLPARGRRPAPPTAPTASRSPSSPACRRPWWPAPRRCWSGWSRREPPAPARLDDLPLFAAVAQPPARQVPVAGAAPAPPSAIEQAIRATNPDDLTPRAALDLLYDLRRRLFELDGGRG